MEGRPIFPLSWCHGFEHMGKALQIRLAFTSLLGTDNILFITPAGLASMLSDKPLHRDCGRTRVRLVGKAG